MKKPKVIAVICDKQDRKPIEDASQIVGYDVLFVDSLPELAKRLSEAHFEGIILDFGMSNQHLEQTYQKIKKSSSRFTPSILVLIDQGMEEDIVRLYEMGVDEIIQRPLHKHLLAMSLKSLTKRTKVIESEVRKKEVARNLFRIVAHDVSNLFINFEVFIRAIEKEKDTETKKKRLAKAKKTLGEVRELLRNVKTLDAMRSESLVLSLTSVPLELCFEQISEVYEEQFSRKNLQINMVWETDKSLNLKADSPSLKHQVLGNILSNAIKYSYPNSTIDVIIRNRGEMAQIIVRDHGVGMNSEVAGRIFNEELSHSREGTSGEKGTGYGMPLAFQFVRAFNGSIKVVSRPKETHKKDHGTDFIIEIPVWKKQAA